MIPSLVTSDRPSVSVCLPARDEQDTIGEIVARCVGLQHAGVIDEVVVMDDSRDRTAAIARQAGATVHDQSAVLSSYGPVQGKGDAMWRALSVLRGDIVVFLDADSSGFDPAFVTRLLEPLLADRRVRFVKGHYRRPFRVGDVETPSGGGRVTQLTARPLLRRCFPELADIRQPLAGEIAADRTLLMGMPFHLGYGVDVGLLIDVWHACGRAAIAEADLEVRRNRHQTLEALHPMACAVSDVILDKHERRESEAVRPPMAEVLDAMTPAGGLAA